VSQCNVQTLGSIVGTLVIQFDQEKFEQLLSKGCSSLINVRKHRKISLAKTLHANAGKQVSVEMKKDLCNPISVSCEAKQTPSESTKVSTTTKLASRQCLYTVCEARKAFCKPKAASKAIWIEKFNSASCEVREKSLYSASREANLALRRARPYLSREAKAKASLCPDSETVST